MLSTRQPKVSVISPTPLGANAFHLFSIYLPKPPASGGCLYSKKPSERGFCSLRLACRVCLDTQQSKREKTMSVIRLGSPMLGSPRGKRESQPQCQLKQRGLHATQWGSEKKLSGQQWNKGMGVWGWGVPWDNGVRMTVTHHVPSKIGQPVDGRVDAADKLQMLGLAHTLLDEEKDEAGGDEGHGEDNTDGHHHIGGTWPPASKQAEQHRILRKRRKANRQ